MMSLDTSGASITASDGDGATISASLAYPPNSTVDDLADLRIVLETVQVANIHLSWRSPARRTSATIYGDRGLLEIEGETILLTGRDGTAEDHSVAEAPDDSYHRPWFAALANQFLDAIAEGADGPIVRRNHAEVRFALAATAAAKASAKGKGIPMPLARGLL
jgi:predicted dehydrogenase